jgi:MATE family multidrug resistance protein
MMAAVLPPASTATQSILMASDLVFTTIPLGLGVAVSHRVGNYLGSSSPSYAKRAARVPYMIALILGALEFICIMSLRHIYAKIFTSDGEVIELTSRILPLMAGFQILDIGNGGASGILRGAGKNHLAGMCNLIAYYGVGLSSAWFLCFKQEMGLFGLWMGIITGSAALLLFQSTFVLFLDWEKEASAISEEREES